MAPASRATRSASADSRALGGEVWLLARVVAPHGRQQRRGKLPLGRAQQGIPDIEDQNEAVLIALVPGFMLNCVVKHPSLAGFFSATVITPAEAAVRGHDQRE